MADPWGLWASLRPARRRLSALLVCGGGLVWRLSAFPDGPWDPAVAWVASLAGSEELACFLSPWGPCERREKLIYSPLLFLNSIQHAYGAQHPPLRPPGPRHVSDSPGCVRLFSGWAWGCGDPPGPWYSDGEESALHSASTNQAVALRGALLAFHGPASIGGSMQRRAEESSLCRVPGLGWGLPHLWSLGLATAA